MCVFPGQGAQKVGMGRDLLATYAVARETFDEADTALGFPLGRLCTEGPADELELTTNAQPGILATSVAAWRALASRVEVAPLALAGHSLGEWSALVVAGAVPLSDALRAVRERGRLMQAAVPVGEGAMAAVLGTDADTVRALCDETRDGQVLEAANLNGGGQIVVAGHTAAVDRLIEAAKRRRLRAQRLPVSAPFHCPLMQPAADGLATFLRDIPFAAPRWPVCSSVDARPIAEDTDLPALLVRQVTAPVRWEDTARALVERTPTVALEVGPGTTLRGLFKRIAPELTVLSVGDAAGVEAAAGALG